ncbi:MAG TPA: glycosyltransferase family 2 protein [Methanothermobacter sp.]|nr:dolichyl-phosphate mannose synthase [Methanothermobacter sp. MT-2]HHW05833.1 glycosyltransferase family 2 protein [Methanothermobacter sp.]HOK72449.1 glycosyltransferase family 2 protein [Methanothermobacter sp.]HOL69148.1 glycosyltransferase family 2 protein [Methanothermobacter sp.]HPQ03936.1 glycosyltransferase family 2 protein [Methanothermobacter sp.]
MNPRDVTIIVPVYNEEGTIIQVINDLMDRGYDIIIVDDGSTDSTPYLLQRFKDDNIKIYRHVINRGLGAALRTGIEAALSRKTSYIVTFDADGQHDPDDIEKVCKPLIDDKADAVIGKRNFSEMPLSRNIGNFIMNIITLIFYGIKVSDSQSGLRAFTRTAASKIKINDRGYGVSSEIISEIKRRGLRLKEVPIKTIYTPETISKGTNLSVGIRILVKLIINILKRL